MSQFLIDGVPERIGSSTSMLMEDRDSNNNVIGKSWKMDGIFLQADIKNHNGRTYPKQEIQNAVNMLNNEIELHGVLGECEHPENLNINMREASHKLLGLKMDGSDGIGRLQILEKLPMGQIIASILESGVKLGVSSRGEGDVDDYTGKVSNFKIVTIDIVVTPSAPEAYPRAVYENFKNMKNSGRILEIAEGKIIGDKIAQKHYGNEIIKIINELKLK